MFKKEIIWRYILTKAIENNQFEFQQQKIAKKFSYSLSTVFNALKKPKLINAIKTGGKGFKLLNLEKFLYLWCTERNLKKDLLYKTFAPLPIEKIEANMPNNISWGLYSAYKYKYNNVPSDYGKVYIYVSNSEEIKKRFPIKKGPANLFVLKKDNYFEELNIIQIFVDIWNTDDWYAQEFINKIKNKLKI